MNILCIGDIVGRPGRDALRELLPNLQKEHQIDFTVVNAENTANGSGLTSNLAQKLFAAGADVLTLGDHTWDQKEIETYLPTTDQVIRPANFPEGAPGQGWTMKKSSSGVEMAVVNILGRTFMRHFVECPFRFMDRLLPQIHKHTPNIIIDFHAEATSEKVAMSHYLNGRATVLFGTHTHIQTADEKVLDQGLAYITDLGMTGPYDSVIGQEKDRIIQRFLTSMPSRFHVAEKDIQLSGIIVGLDPKTGRAHSIQRVHESFVPSLE